MRLAQPSIGEYFAVTGLGLIGLITVQILRANGCRVLGIDVDSRKCDCAEQFGAEVVDLSKHEDPVDRCLALSRKRGLDGVLITAATNSDEPIHQAAAMCRKRGRIVLVGVTGLTLSRDDFYKKELSFQVSCSYGPGRYDQQYEQAGNDYPIGFVRWTAHRNFEAILDLMEQRRLDVQALISHRFTFEDAAKAYKLLTERKEHYLGILLEYDQQRIDDSQTVVLQQAIRPCDGQLRTAVIGAGNYAGRVLIPAFKKAGVFLDTLINSGSVRGSHQGRKYGFRALSTDSASVMNSADIDAVVVATRHASHARYVIQALQSGKHVFVEKPLALTLAELDAIEQAYCSHPDDCGRPLLMVGFNRRFSLLVDKMKEMLLSMPQPKMITATINAGMIPDDHWTQDLAEGGGRIVGEACHFVDLARHLVGSQISEASIQVMGARTAGTLVDDNALITLAFADGSAAAIQYLANGHKAYPKERIEVFVGGRILQLNNFRSLQGWGWPGFRRIRLWRQDKGQNACAASFARAVLNGGPAPIPFEELLEVSRVSLRLGQASRS